MASGVKRRVHRVAAILALLAVGYYAFLLPGHLVAQFASEVLAAEYGTSAGTLCSSKAGADNSGTPSSPAAGCPICKGLAAFHLALAPVPQALLPAPEAGRVALLVLPGHLADSHPHTPRSRGPPLPA